MPLADDIDRLRNETVVALIDAHNYHWNTIAAWRLVQQMVDHGRKISITNAPTGSTIRGSELSSLGQKYVGSYLSSATFQHFIALFEWFTVDFMTHWLRAFPKSLGKQQVDFATVLDSKDKAEIVDRAIERKLIDIAYGPVTKWMSYLKETTGISQPDDEQIRSLAEIKASRDVLVHNNGIVNAIYLQKAGHETRFKRGGKRRFQIGDSLELPPQYHRESWEFIRQVVNDIADAGIMKIKK